METWLVITLLGGVFLFLMLNRVPVALSFLAANIVVLVAYGGTRFFDIISSGMFNSLNSFIMIAVPLFVIMGEIIVRCGLVDVISSAVESIFGRLRAQSALITVGTGTILATLSGAPLATSATLGSTMVPKMISEGYKKWFACGTALGGAALAALIPPSGLAIVLATLAEVSPSKVLIGGLVPGIIIAILFVVYIIVMSYINPDVVPANTEVKQNMTTQERIVNIARALPLLIIVFLVVGVIILGIATATEAAALGAVGSIIVALAYRRLTWKILLDSLYATAKMTTMIFLIMSCSSIFGRVLSLTGAGPEIVDAIVTSALSPYAIIGLMIVCVLIMGCFMDSIALMMITIPLFTPAVIELGFEPIWFCVLILITLGIAGLTPPVGLTLYALKGSCPEVGMEDVYSGGVPFFLIQILMVIITMFIPAIALWLPCLI